LDEGPIYKPEIRQRVLRNMHERAESCYPAGDFFCSETVLKVIHENSKTGIPEEIVSPQVILLSVNI
jgi:hypothetical protein